VSEDLAAFIPALLDNPDIDVPLTLGFVRQRIVGAGQAPVGLSNRTRAAVRRARAARH
jgi:hypothetical protein